MHRTREVLLSFLLTLFSGSCYARPFYSGWPSSDTQDEGSTFCLSWHLGVEANNVRAWRTVPTLCQRHVKNYMNGGQYEHDLDFIVDHINTYVDTINLSYDGLDAWIMDIDDTCISNLLYYRGKRFGCDPYDPDGFKNWAGKGTSPAILPVLRLFGKLVATGFKVFLVTGRDEITLGQPTLNNLNSQGFIGYEKVILRNATYKGQSAIVYKSEIRKQLEREGYRIWGNVGDQWSDLQGDCTGNRTFKLPNPMYFVP